MVLVGEGFVRLLVVLVFTTCHVKILHSNGISACPGIDNQVQGRSTSTGVDANNLQPQMRKDPEAAHFDMALRDTLRDFS